MMMIAAKSNEQPSIKASKRRNDWIERVFLDNGDMVASLGISQFFRFSGHIVTVVGALNNLPFVGNLLAIIRRAL